MEKVLLFSFCFIKKLLSFLALANSNNNKMKQKLSGILTVLLLLVVQIGFAQQKMITGTVVDSEGLPLPGVNVLIQNTNRGT
ncbi:carboxypeptidase-like regulatory domain-containing protein, partial [Tamlana crocina]